jgi:hypothetical protein
MSIELARGRKRDRPDAARTDAVRRDSRRLRGSAGSQRFLRQKDICLGKVEDEADALRDSLVSPFLRAIYRHGVPAAFRPAVAQALSGINLLRSTACQTPDLAARHLGNVRNNLFVQPCVIH